MSPLTLKTFLALAKERGGRCVSEIYYNSNTPLAWRCAWGHEWSAVPASIRKGSWCPECAGVKRLTIGKMRSIAQSRGAGPVFVRGVSKQGHESDVDVLDGTPMECATAAQIIKGHWCPYCARVVRLSLREFQKMAERRKGRCLSSEYQGSARHLLWRCALGHEWLARARSVRAGTWCPICAGNQRTSLKEMHRLARLRSGKCLCQCIRMATAGSFGNAAGSTDG